ncbi:MAG: hypothetical protein M1814_001520 [Vezdaea aestivalis]|nr:MAG: hypothetical protein M1814_001520 [Vezdaea aestivalis]
MSDKSLRSRDRHPHTLTNARLNGPRIVKKRRVQPVPTRTRSDKFNIIRAAADEAAGDPLIWHTLCARDRIIWRLRQGGKAVHEIFAELVAKDLANINENSVHRVFQRLRKAEDKARIRYQAHIAANGPIPHVDPAVEPPNPIAPGMPPIAPPPDVVMPEEPTPIWTGPIHDFALPEWPSEDTDPQYQSIFDGAAQGQAPSTELPPGVEMINPALYKWGPEEDALLMEAYNAVKTRIKDSVEPSYYSMLYQYFNERSPDTMTFGPWCLHAFEQRLRHLSLEGPYASLQDWE